MIAAWMLWSAGIGLLFLVAGLAAERLLTLGERPTRWVWMVAGVGTVALPLLRILGGSPGPEVAPPAGQPVLLEPLAVTVSRDSVLHSLDDILVLGWIVLSSLLVVAVLFAILRLVSEGKSWRAGSLKDRSVFWSRNTGPTVVGLFRPRVVLPAWVRAAGARERELILAHEEEHIRAGDARLRFLMTLPVLAFPWNPALWLQRHRLGLAIELDCDRRVMRRMPGERRAYGELLLRVGAGRAGLHRLAIVSLAEGRSQLERRIRGLVQGTPRARRIKVALLALGVAALVVLAVLLPRIRGEGGGAIDEEFVDLMAEPTFTPFTVRPDLVNEREVQRALEAEYPPVLRDAGMGGTVQVRFFIDAEGEVRRVLVAQPSGHEALDSAALRVARVFRFTPALNLEEAVPVWIAIPITFGTRDEAAEVPEEVREFLDSIRRQRASGTGNRPGDSAVPQEAPVADTPTVTPFTVRPDLVNEEEIMQAMEAEYPPILRDAGIGGTTQVHFFIDTEGVVQRVLVAQTSGHEPLDSAALRVARIFRFTPALNEDEVVPVWIAIPITFQTREFRDGQSEARQAGDARAQAADPQVPAADPSELPPSELVRESTFPRYTVRPDLAPAREVQRAIEREYPPILREAGIGGTVRVYFFIDENGRVQRTLVPRHATLDEAARAVADVYQFTPTLPVAKPKPPGSRLR